MLVIIFGVGMRAIDLIERIEFEEKRHSGYRIPLVHTKYYIKEGKLREFLKLCSDNKSSLHMQDSLFDYGMKRVLRSKAKRPRPIQLYINSTRADIYPKENLIVVDQGGLYYVCQHSFDILPYEERQLFYTTSVELERNIGELVTLEGEKFIVNSSDILQGFILHKEQIDEYNNRLGVWIKSRREKNG